jgi:hypothetical protein
MNDAKKTHIDTIAKNGRFVAHGVAKHLAALDAIE